MDENSKISWATIASAVKTYIMTGILCVAGTPILLIMNESISALPTATPAAIAHCTPARRVGIMVVAVASVRDSNNCLAK